jgi:hypothetical protein
MLAAIDAPLQQVDLLRLAREDVDHGEAVGIAVLEVLQGLVEHHAGHAAVAVDQGEFAARLLFQGGGGNRQDGRDARAGGKADAVDRARALHGKAPLGRHHRQHITGVDVGGGPIGKHAALYRADPHLNFTEPCQAAARAADGVGAAHVLPFDARAQRQELARLEGKGLAPLGRHRQGDGHRTGRLGADALDLKIVKVGRGHGGPSIEKEGG